jgi:hypothetical protein
VAPVISTQPVSQTFAYCANAILSVSATGSGPLAYQWRLNGIILTGATNSSLTLNTRDLASAGLYSVTVTGPGGSVTSAVAAINIAPVLTSQFKGPSLTLTWPAPFVLQSATSPAGPYTDVPNASSPYVFNVSSGPQSFFRLRAPSLSLTGASIPGKQFSLSTPGIPGYNLIIQASTDLAHWQNLATNASPCTFVDADAPNYPHRFYRVVVSP